MTREDDVAMSPDVAAELLHAEVAHLLARAGVPVLHVKGPTVVRWLHPGGGRPWGDVDVLVPRDRLDEALAVLAAHGFGERFPGVTHHTSEDHAVVLARPDLSPGNGEVDLHHRFPGITVPPAQAWSVLWARRVAAELAHLPVWFPDLSTRAVLVALNTARSGTAQAMLDLERLCGPDATLDWSDVAALADQLGALPALRAGLELVPAGAAVVRDTPALAAVDVTAEWRLRTVGASRTAVRVAELGSLSLRHQLVQVARWLVPHPSVMRMRDPRTAASRGALARGYGRRLVEGARATPAALRAVRGARRG
ncbi:nucleotidyltransferase family protein [Rhodococcus antarcticus]|uniref:Nucleotidyltransferase family protein n=1 Tax=Rhodococcus antarcticus TaxID=2987751 RepID=A0ABY6P126_9NOCA|nr:nucleotidyltransferase family protein [Rhodococcus antarcticus]UZJ24971.1 nucleotidyltransferase family protein [Rhodococcus antarcticus]